MEQQFYLGLDEEEQIEYGMSSANERKIGPRLRQIAQELRIGQRSLAAEIGISRATLAKVLAGEPVKLSRGTMVKVLRAINRFGSGAHVGGESKLREQS